MNMLTRLNPFRSPAVVERSALSRWNPLQELERMQNDLDRLFQACQLNGNGGEEIVATQWSPSVDISEDDREYLLKAELPEVKKEDVKVSVADGVLSMRGERKTEKEEKGKKYHRIERSYGSFERSFTLPQDTESAKITSEFKDGVLSVHLPKNVEAKPKALDIKVQ